MKKILNCFIFLSTLFSFFNLSAHQYKLTVASKFRNEGPYLKEWIEYHRLAGVEHFWLYNDTSLDNSEEVLAPYVKEGLVEVFPWNATSALSHFADQIEAFRDAIIRAKGVSTWIALLDIDEFLLPMKEATVSECLEKHFSEANAVYANWRCFGSGGIYLSSPLSLLFNLTACSLKNHPENNPGKSILRPEWADLNAMWSPHFCLLKDNAPYHNGDGEKVFFTENIFKTDGRTHTKFIRINHYIMRDENYFQNVRVARAKNGYNGYSQGNLPLLLEQNVSFSLIQDTEIIKFIEKHHKQAAGKIWQHKEVL